MSKYVFVSVGRLEETDDLEIRHYIPEGDFEDTSIEAFDVRFMKHGYLDVEIDLPIWLAKKLVKELKKCLKYRKKNLKNTWRLREKMKLGKEK